MKNEEYIMQLIDIDVQEVFDTCKVPNSDPTVRALRECQRRKIRLSYAEEAFQAANYLVLNDPQYDAMKASPSRYWAFLSMGWAAVESTIHWICSSVDQHGFKRGEGRIEDWKYVLEHREHMSHPEHRSKVVQTYLNKTSGHKIQSHANDDHWQIRCPLKLGELPNRSIGHVLRRCMDDADRFLEEKFHDASGEKWIGPSAKQIMWVRNGTIQKNLAIRGLPQVEHQPNRSN